MRKWVILALRLFLGIVFIYASWDKILHPGAFAEAIYNYQILPDTLINFTAIVLPWFELFLGICVIFGIWLPGAVFSINALLTVFFAALLFNLARGLDIHCGCFSSSAQSGESGSTLWYLTRDAAFLISGFLLFSQIWPRKKRL
ncbi:hypothetical protein DENIS_0944 [Desulfonema ishimotonii]|uniref:Methylamine utilisation protein MauE domain-containing protein n=1 Tax=Desulfonema ishimotonii TaxID=45657 RepID=A0A401FSP8_9BACT|nr:MauE/DoxX family redox-associated membrane protein [Desulfonema ishimotonii]GBC60002.1 hypothetical protein DENIS_0944 [Desulfonema ishimotonii]